MFNIAFDEERSERVRRTEPRARGEPPALGNSGFLWVLLFVQKDAPVTVCVCVCVWHAAFFLFCRMTPK